MMHQEDSTLKIKRRPPKSLAARFSSSQNLQIIDLSLKGSTTNIRKTAYSVLVLQLLEGRGEISYIKDRVYIIVKY